MIWLVAEPDMSGLGLTQAQLDTYRASEEMDRTENACISECLDVNAASALIQLISDISEECYCAGWLTGCGADMRHFVTEWDGVSTQRFGMGEISPAQLDTMRALAVLAGGWPEYRRHVAECQFALYELLPLTDEAGSEGTVKP